MDPRFRLKRPIPGEWLVPPTPIVARAEARERARPTTLELPERDTAASYSSTRGRVRQAKTGTIEPAPNAPQLIRLVRTPFALDRGAFGRQPLMLINGVQAELTRQPRSPYREELVAAFADARPPRWPSPTGSRPVVSQVRPPVPSIEEWLRTARRPA